MSLSPPGDARPSRNVYTWLRCVAYRNGTPCVGRVFFFFALTFCGSWSAGRKVVLIWLLLGNNGNARNVTMAILATTHVDFFFAVPSKDQWPAHIAPRTRRSESTTRAFGGRLFHGFVLAPALLIKPLLLLHTCNIIPCFFLPHLPLFLCDVN
jgi:hypothetical protein